MRPQNETRISGGTVEYLEGHRATYPKMVPTWPHLTDSKSQKIRLELLPYRLEFTSSELASAGRSRGARDSLVW